MIDSVKSCLQFTKTFVYSYWLLQPGDLDHYHRRAADYVTSIGVI